MQLPSAIRFIALAALLGGCAVAPAPPVDAPALLHDELFDAGATPIDAAGVFAVDDAMRDFVHTRLAAQLRRDGARRGLVAALYDKDLLRLRYDDELTRNAAQTFAARAGNCLSLVIMTSAFAKELGLPVHYHLVWTDETWSRSGDIYFASTHVNLSIGNGTSPGFRVASDDADETTVDFLPSQDLRRQRWHDIGEETVVAMYMNNRAAESLARGRIDDAYAWARAAIRTDPRFLDGVNTLGVIYQRHGNAAQAEAAFAAVLSREPDNTAALSNLALVLRNSGRTAEADKVAAHLASIEPFPPLHYFNLGLTALKQGEYAAARDLFQRELRHAAYYHEVHFGLALAYFRLGDQRRARAEISEAMEDSTNAAEKRLYAAKLAWMESLRGQ